MSLLATVATTATLGFPRMGPNRELKFALERHWKGNMTHEELLRVAGTVEDAAWAAQKERGLQLDRITVGDHYLYDGILQWVDALGIVPERFRGMERDGMTRMFAMARGNDQATALSMKKWLTSNYHYMVPEYDGKGLDPNFDAYLASVRRGVEKLGVNCATPVVIGPVTLVYLTKMAEDSGSRMKLLHELIPIYKDLLGKLAELRVAEIQVHEAALVFEDSALLSYFRTAYPHILNNVPKTTAMNMVSFMEDVGEEHYQWLIAVKEFSILSLDLTRGETLRLIETFGFPEDKILGAGLVDCRSVWPIQPDRIRSVLSTLKPLVRGIRIQPSGSLQFVPWDVSTEAKILEHPAGAILSFAKQKLEEVQLVAKALAHPSCLGSYEVKWTRYQSSVAEIQAHVKGRLANLEASDFCRAEAFHVRRPKQLVKLPVLPTTTIGSFPQTKAIRSLRSKYNKGLLTQVEYDAAIDQQIAYNIGIQEGLGLDILVHGEPERTDMVEYFAQQMEGMLFTQNGWVQSFGSRCVRPPIIWADIYRPHQMTVRTYSVAQALTDKPVKGMLTGPVTMLNWSFPRSDITLKEQAFQLALCIRDEITDLENAGCVVVQVDEPALREAMPLRSAKQQDYLDWAVDAFRLSTANAASETQIHTHMCYCEFNDCMDAIDKMDADVNSIENARSEDAEILKAFNDIGYCKDIGPGTYDIHSPVVPPVSFFLSKISSFLQYMDARRLVVNPDCGLKTRTWPETVGALRNMVEATHCIRRDCGCH